MDDRTKSCIFDMIESIQNIYSFINDADYDTFENSNLLQSAVIRQFEILGEAANRINKDIQKQYPEIPWKELIGMRNVLIHGYDEIEVGIVWKAYKNEILQIKESLENILKSS